MYYGKTSANKMKNYTLLYRIAVVAGVFFGIRLFMNFVTYMDGYGVMDNEALINLGMGQISSLVMLTVAIVVAFVGNVLTMKLSGSRVFLLKTFGLVISFFSVQISFPALAQMLFIPYNNMYGDLGNVSLVIEELGIVLVANVYMFYAYLVAVGVLFVLTLGFLVGIIRTNMKRNIENDGRGNNFDTSI